MIEELEKARRRSLETKFPERLDWLTRSLLGLRSFLDEKRRVLSASISSLPYQLLSGIGGTLLEAQCQHSTAAIFVVHEFRTTATVDSKLETNAKALNSFLRLLCRANSREDQNFQLDPGQMIGPISIVEHPPVESTSMLSDMPLFVGKIRTDRLGN